MLNDIMYYELSLCRAVKSSGCRVNRVAADVPGVAIKLLSGYTYTLDFCSVDFVIMTYPNGDTAIENMAVSLTELFAVIK